MKRKGLTIGLALVVISVWGAVLAKAIKPSSAEEVDPNVVATVTRQVTVADSLPASSTLGNYRDPFLGAEAPSVRREPVDGKRPVAVKKIAPSTPVPSFTWPQVAFKGMLKNTNKNQGVALVSINGQDKLLVEGKEEQGVMLIAVARDSITLKARGEMRRFGR